MMIKWSQVLQNQKYFVFDLDGTILDSDRTLIDGVHEAISLLVQRGVCPIIATGRPLSSFKTLDFPPGFLDLFNRYIICNDGNVVYDRLQEQPIFIETLDENEYVDFTRSVQDDTVDIVVEANGTHYAHSMRAAQQFLKVCHLGEHSITQVEMDGFTPHNITEIVLFPKAGAEEELYEKIDYVDSIMWYVQYDESLSKISIIPENTSKATGLKWVLAQLGAGLNQTIAFGDGNNDIDLFRECMLGIAVQSSSPKAAAVAHYQLEIPIGHYLRSILEV